MTNNRKQKLAAGAAVLATAAGAGAAAAATQSAQSNRSPGGRAFVEDAASRLHVQPQDLRSALSGAYVDRLQQAVADGQLSQAEAAAIRQRMEQGGGMPWLRLAGAHHHGHGALVRSAARYLGLRPEDLRAELRSGRSLAQVAAARGRSADGLKAALTATVRRRLGRAVADGRISAEQQREVLARLPGRLERLVQRRWRKA